MSNRTLSLPPRFWVDKCPCDEFWFEEVFALMVELHAEGGYARLNRQKARPAVWAVLNEGTTFLARLEEQSGGDPAGLPIGVLAMTEQPFWYGDETFLVDHGFYVKPKYRKGRVGVSLLKAAREEAQARNKIAIIAVTNPDRAPKLNGVTVISQNAGFVPVGYTLRLN